ncbi:MAG: cytochrome c oxidase assembly protein [Candidatus Sericytochromatia bacterium]|nr:cytochrome c oxidase assembly protein [Candidatus Tanganyikabacteria bacterium]
MPSVRPPDSARERSVARLARVAKSCRFPALLAMALVASLASQGATYAASEARSVSVRWLGFAPKELKVAIAPDRPFSEVPLGKSRTVRFKFTNLGGARVAFKALHTVDPGEAEKHLSKTVCFCFENQTLGPHETKELPVDYTINRRLPADISDIVVSYRLVSIADTPAKARREPGASRGTR